MKTVLAPIDFSEISRHVVAEAVSLAQAIGGRLVLLHVVQSRPPLASDFGVLAARVAAAESAAAGERLADLQQELQAEGITAHAMHGVGAAGSRIVTEAGHLRADFIVMGSHGHSAFYDVMIGSTASHVLKRARCPVVLLPPGGKAAGGPRSRRAVFAGVA